MRNNMRYPKMRTHVRCKSCCGTGTKLVGVRAIQMKCAWCSGTGQMAGEQLARWIESKAIR